jgi:hypothetical protein
MAQTTANKMHGAIIATLVIALILMISGEVNIGGTVAAIAVVGGIAMCPYFWKKKDIASEIEQLMPMPIIVPKQA